MKKVLFIAVLVALSLRGYPQGVNFDQESNLQRVLSTAKKAHKFIFVDCYATWCGPCKEMERSVYSVDSVGAFMNEHFICVKVQMDRTPKDNDTVKAWYADAKTLESTYKITAYPTLLFFDNNGKAVHRVEGGFDPRGFLQTAQAALDPEKQYYTLLDAFNAHQTKNQLLPVLATELSRLGSKPMALQVAATYMHQYLDRLSDTALLTPANTAFLERYETMIMPADRIFKLCYNEPGKVGGILKDKDFADQLVTEVIKNTELDPVCDAAKKTGAMPDFQKIKQAITRKYNAHYADIVITNGKVGWYGYLIKAQKDKNYWPEYTTALITQIRKFRYDTVAGAAMGINNICWNIFVHNDNKAQLLTLADVMKTISEKNAKTDYLDTYACLLYRGGDASKAVSAEEQALQIAEKHKDQHEADYLRTTMAKMKNGEQIWAEKEYTN